MKVGQKFMNLYHDFFPIDLIFLKTLYCSAIATGFVALYYRVVIGR
jgi:hypothetical protein